ncbi:MAG: hypothetical protein A3F35_01525 [Candidatus Woykebacteria bacterium RIFCSPHIGHO2_12_FULL_45_10]|uniref:ZIP zinc transporter n=1 Tax=Candidatus Woykebacteria bacterium RIFCSPHIGHO2_12_FULL_45_10 TaxID=1802603 RepID=A0A1G1WNS2_9BACT|nr:MAG: hypothetical protein A3F35_01525 [Candidatus Woykebacteria bacterium RIFCSPHIGHO2_12_FULL_45_10]
MSSTLVYILIFNFAASLLSLTGGVILLLKTDLMGKIAHLLASFAAGALLGTVFFDLLPEAANIKTNHNIFLWTLVGVLAFFFLERSVHWLHHHQHPHQKSDSKPTVLLLLLGDTVHNFIDGVAIATTFLVSVPLGIVTSVAVAAHEIPQEIGDFGVMLNEGYARRKIVLFNLFSAFASIVGAVITFFIGARIEGYLPILLALTAGFFIYIAASDLIPEIHENNLKGFAALESFLLVAGVFTIWIFVSLLG